MFQLYSAMSDEEQEPVVAEEEEQPVEAQAPPSTGNGSYVSKSGRHMGPTLITGVCFVVKKMITLQISFSRPVFSRRIYSLSFPRSFC